MGNDYTLQLVDAPSEDDVLERRARACETAEGLRLRQINEAETRLQEAAEEERTRVATAAMADWWDARRIQLKEAVKHEVEKQINGGADGTAEAQEVRGTPLLALLRWPRRRVLHLCGAPCCACVLPPLSGENGGLGLGVP